MHNVRTYHRVNGIGELIQVQIIGCDVSGDRFKNNRQAIAYNDCTACSWVLNGAGANECLAHGVRRVEHVVN